MDMRGDAVASWLVHSALDEAHKRSRFKSWPGTLRCVLGQDTLLSVPLCTHLLPFSSTLQSTLILLTRNQPCVFLVCY